MGRGAGASVSFKCVRAPLSQEGAVAGAPGHPPGRRAVHNLEARVYHGSRQHEGGRRQLGGVVFARGAARARAAKIRHDCTRSRPRPRARGAARRHCPSPTRTMWREVRLVATRECATLRPSCCLEGLIVYWLRLGLRRQPGIKVLYPTGGHPPKGRMRDGERLQDSIRIFCFWRRAGHELGRGGAAAGAAFRRRPRRGRV